jgi:hypothetical protein
MEDPGAMQPQPPTPLPPSAVATDAETLAPLLEGGNLVWGSWSPDSAYFLLGQQDNAGNVTLSFLDGQDGTLCTVDGSYAFPPFTVSLRSYHAWLSDGQLLLLDGAGQMALVMPCTPGVRAVPPGPTETPEIMATDDENRHMLVKEDDAFWILDGRALAWQPIAGVTPNPYEAHWDNAAWQPDGAQLAIARLNGRDANDGTTLYLIDGESGEVLRELPLTAASDQSAPRVDWLSPHELMLGSGGVLRILDLSSDPPQATDVLPGLFGLDLDFPDEVWGHGWQVEWDAGRYLLTVHANHPRNQSLYVYHSDTGAVDVYEEDANLLLRYPNGEMEQWTKAEGEPVGPDTFVLIDVGEGRVYPPFTVAGHTPRDYPRLGSAYLAQDDQLAVLSSQGISLHALPGGEVTDFWVLAGQGFAPFARAAPDASALVVIRDQGGLYWLPLP